MYNLPSAAMYGKIWRSIDVFTGFILLIIDLLKIYIPALILSLRKGLLGPPGFPALIEAVGFSTNCLIWPPVPGTSTTTPYFDGSSTLVTTMVPSSPCALWNFRSSANGYGQLMSALSMKKGSASSGSSSDAARAMG